MPPAAPRVLVVEEDAALAETLAGELRDLGHDVVVVPSLGSASEQVKGAGFDVLVVELAATATDALKQIAVDQPSAETIVLTGFAGVGAALDAMKDGAYGYVTRPPRPGELGVLVDKAAEKARLRRDRDALGALLDHRSADPVLVADAPAMRELVQTLERVAPSDLPVLILGERGVGKQRIARAVHAASPRSGRAFVAVDCGATPEGQLDATLFGREGARGTPPAFEIADRGTLFLDRVDALPAAVQARLLRALETHANVRVVSATARDLKTDMAEGRFRADLYYRLAGVTLQVPALRERPGDLPSLARQFLGREAPGRTFTPRALQALGAHTWPGNARELELVVQRAALLARGDAIDAEDLRLGGHDGRSGEESGPSRPGLTLAEMEREYILAVLRQNEGHRGKTARALGIDPKTLYNKLGPERPRRKPST